MLIEKVSVQLILKKKRRGDIMGGAVPSQVCRRGDTHLLPETNGCQGGAGDEGEGVAPRGEVPTQVPPFYHRRGPVHMLLPY